MSNYSTKNQKNLIGDTQTHKKVREKLGKNDVEKASIMQIIIQIQNKCKQKKKKLNFIIK